MRYELIVCEHCDKETEAVESFFKWQGIKYIKTDSRSECMRLTNGNPAPCLLINGFFYAYGFFNIVRMMQREGLILC